MMGAERRRHHTRKKTRLLTPFRQPALVLRWFVDDPHIAQLAVGDALSMRTCHRYPHEEIDVLSAQTPRCSRP
ncbi:hypothetical protein [Streptomyces chiangmaiensis]|uniref:Uncharacterized protein n=1 Tax=Streptomyces chiangmaiensis TaxID=766497 RepID=A0ABU7FYU3_9ACTN|nr:hypothetical protein [Streptomyces chiangmaiensis]MED7828279.1 hypothetical protein [Streptomyces chiangmaiensis]